jgi:hypothetical protein
MEPLKAVSRRANSLARALKPSLTGQWEVRVIDEEARVGVAPFPLPKYPVWP